jgi:hypothetical protein
LISCRAPLGAGDLVASARDVVALAAATVNGQLLPPESAREQLTPYVQCGPGTWQGLGVQVEQHGPVRLVGHSGAFPGFEAAAYACRKPAERRSAHEHQHEAAEVSGTEVPDGEIVKIYRTLIRSLVFLHP